MADFLLYGRNVIRLPKADRDPWKPCTPLEVPERETDLVLRGLTIDQKPLKDHMEAVAHKEAFNFVSELVKDNVPISESIIKQIHYLVLADKKEDRGVYRRVPVRIMGA